MILYLITSFVLLIINSVQLTNGQNLSNVELNLTLNNTINPSLNPHINPVVNSIVHSNIKSKLGYSDRCTYNYECDDLLFCSQILNKCIRKGKMIIKLIGIKIVN